MARFPKTFLWRLVLAVMCVQIVLVILIGMYAYGRTKSAASEQALDTLHRLAPFLIDRYRGALSGGDVAAMRALVAEDSHESDTRITIIQPDGVVLADSHADPDQMENHRLRVEINEALAEGAGVSTRYSRTVERRLMYVARRVTDGERVLGVVRVAVPTAAIEASVAESISGFVVISMAALLGNLLVVLILSRRFSAQTVEIGREAARIAAGDLRHRIRGPDVQELNELSNALNDVAAQLARRIAQAESQEREMRAILQSMSNGVLALDPAQRILNMNRAAREMLDLDASAVEGRLLQEAVREPELHMFVEHAMEQGSLRPIEFRLADNVLIQASAEVLRDRAGATRGLLVVMHDVTQLRRLESMRSDFAANVSHELRTPITNIKGYVETLLDVGADDPNQTQRFLSIVRTNADRLAAIVEDVLSLTRLERSGALERMDREDAEIARIIGAVVSQFRSAANRKSITIEQEIEPGLRAFVHAAMIEQAVGNLLSNAIAYSPPQTAVRLAAFRRDGEVVIEVTDEGPGIAPKHQPRLFERFYRVDKGRSRELGGTGLGLAIVKHIMNAHGGRAEVESAPGQGSTFRLVVPLAEDAVLENESAS